MTSAPPDVRSPQPPASATRARVVFVDVARAVAVLFMIMGHSLNVFLAPGYQQGRGFAAFMFVRGLTSCTFLALSGFAFMIASVKYWDAHLHLSFRLVRRVRRFVFFVLLGYAMRFPVERWAHFAFLTPDRWRYFLTVDILQCIGMTLVLLEVLVLATRTPRRFALTAAVLGAGVALATPAVWRADWTSVLPVGVAAYLSPATGSLFPVFPWAAFMLLGVALGHVYATAWPADPPAFTRRVLLPGGAALVAAGLLLHQLPWNPLGAGEFSKVSPNFLLIRAGCVLLVLALIAHLTRAVTHLPRVVAALAQESLLIYFIHIVVLYGSRWNVGLTRLLPVPFGPGPAVAGVAAMLVAMSLMAWGWNWTKRRHRWVAFACKAGVAAGVYLSVR